MENRRAYGGKQKLSLFKGNQIKVPLAKIGKWSHPTYGEVSFTDKDLKQLKKNYEKNSTGFTPYATFGHLDEEHHSTDSARKRGDMKEVILEEDVAYGIFDVNEDVYESVLDGEYEYASGEFNRNFMDKEGKRVGTTLLRVALTNSPFIPFGDAKIEALSANNENCPENNLSSVFLLSIDAANKEEAGPQPEVEEPKSEEKPKEEPKKEKVIPVSPEELSTSIADKVAEKLKATSDNEKTSGSEELEPTNNKQDKDTNNIMTDVNKEVAKDPNLEAATQAVLGEEPKKEETVVKEEKTEEVKPVTKVEAAKEDTSKYDALIAKLESIEANYTNKLDAIEKASQDVIKELTAKLEEATVKLENQEAVTQQFSASVSKSQEAALIQNLQNNGVQAPVVQKFLSFKEAYNNSEDKSIVKFSVGSGEEAKVIEKTVVDSVADMLIAASNATPIVQQQLGITSGTQPGSFSNIIERNRELAKKQSI